MIYKSVVTVDRWEKRKMAVKITVDGDLMAMEIAVGSETPVIRVTRVTLDNFQEEKQRFHKLAQRKFISEANWDTDGDELKYMQDRPGQYGSPHIRKMFKKVSR